MIAPCVGVIIACGAAAHFEKSKLDLNRDSEAVLRIVKTAIGDEMPCPKSNLSDSLPLDSIVSI
jgi:hypothetical protein